MSELFDEVDEEVRRDQLKKLWDQYSLYIIAGMILIIAAVGGWRGYQYVEAKKAAEAGAAFDKAVELSEANKHTEAEAAFADLVAKAPFGYRVLARLRMATEVANRDPQAAAKMFDEITADRSVGVAEQDLARIRAAQLAAGKLQLSQHERAPRGRCRAGRHLPPYRARIAGAVGMARQRCRSDAAMAGFDRQ